MVVKRFSSARRYSTDRDLTRLSYGISRLACHRGFLRSEIVSPVLRRFLPFRREADRSLQEAKVKAMLVTAALDLKTIDYLQINVGIELDMARSRIQPTQD